MINQRFNRRACEPQQLLKQIKKQSLKRTFDLSKSLFHSWKTDLQRHYRKCFLADMQYSKIYKFVKDPVDYQAVQDVLLENFALIFEQYVHGQSSSNYPTVSMLDFTNLCKDWKIVAKRDLSVTDIDRLFYAVNFEEVKGESGVDLEDNPDQELCRYEFFEILVRMAKLKFENQKLNLSVADSVRKLLDEYVSKMALQQRWHGLRRRDIWTLEVHDMLEANKYQLKQFI